MLNLFCLLLSNRAFRMLLNSKGLLFVTIKPDLWAKFWNSGKGLSRNYLWQAIGLVSWLAAFYVLPYLSKAFPSSLLRTFAILIWIELVWIYWILICIWFFSWCDVNWQFDITILVFLVLDFVCYSEKRRRLPLLVLESQGPRFETKPGCVCSKPVAIGSAAASALP